MRHRTRASPAQRHFFCRARTKSIAASTTAPIIPAKKLALNVYNDNNEKIGSVNDLLIDKSGNIKAAVIGVGGFLGMGEHPVAVSFDKIKFFNKSVPSATSSNTNSNTNPAGANRPASTTTTGSASMNRVTDTQAMSASTAYGYCCPCGLDSLRPKPGTPSGARWQSEAAAQLILRLNQPQIEKRPPCGWPFRSFFKVSGKELGSLGLRFLIHFGVVSER
jgi:hypothetical protein